MTILLGDLHGNFELINYFIKKVHLSDCNIIQVGDLGVLNDDFYSRLGVLNIVLSENKINFYAIRGNHDNPKYFDGKHGYSNIFLLKDYTVLDIDNKKILFIGGAISVDRVISISQMKEYESYGIKKELYWKDEGVVDNYTDDIKDIDIVITHTSPDWCYPDNSNGFGEFVLNYAKNDPNLLKDLLEERQKMSLIFNKILKSSSVKKHFYGHFHKSAKMVRNNIEHILLSVGEFYNLEEYSQEYFKKI